MLIMSSWRLIDSFKTSPLVRPCSTRRALCKIFCVLDIELSMSMPKYKGYMTYSYSTNPPKTAKPPYREIASATASPRIPSGRAIGARELRATTVTPASKGPPR